MRAERIPAGRLLSAAAAAVVAALCGAFALHGAEPGGANAGRLSALQDEMKRLKGELNGLEARERTVLGDVARMDAELALRRAELEESTLRLRTTESRLTASESNLASIAAEQDRRAPLLARRLRALYKRGPVALLAAAFDPLGGSSGLEGVRYASYLSRHDAGQLADWRTASRRLSAERETLSLERTRLASLKSEASRKAAALDAGRAQRTSLLARIRGDREQHEKAFEELSEAARSLGRLVESFDDATSHVALDVRKFRGLLDWPAAGLVSATFGTVVHPRFKTEVPHPGLDIDAPEGDSFRTIFDGRVAYASPLPGYGLTVVVDHGHGVVTIYAHAAVLLVETGQDVLRGQELGRVGDSGSLRGPYLYFEVREAGRAVDPALWLRRH
jgi:septal ring factor EnvC (AmiA/AmiB activator)